MSNDTFFLHGYESSGSGTKGRFFSHHFPHIHCPDFTGSLRNRLDQLQELCAHRPALTFIGSSYGGLMAVIYGLRQPDQIDQLILMAPALNYEQYQPPHEKSQIPTLLIIGKNDTITPADIVIPLVQSTFIRLEIRVVDDDHMLNNTFHKLDWESILTQI